MYDDRFEDSRKLDSLMLLLMLWVSTICIICISKKTMTFTQIPSTNHGINKSHLIQILHQDLLRTKLLVLLKQRKVIKQPGNGVLLEMSQGIHPTINFQRQSVSFRESRSLIYGIESVFQNGSRGVWGLFSGANC